MSSVSSVSDAASGWSRFLGLSLRPWSGAAPLSLIVRGAIQLVIAVIIANFVIGMLAESRSAEYAGLGDLRGLLTMLLIVFILMGVVGGIQLVIGIIDLLPRRSAEGVVVSLKQRKAGDFLPYMAQRLIFENRSSGIDRRRNRLELVLETAEGQRQWTVRSARARRALQVGARVSLSVTPLTGYVARVDPLTP